MPLNRFRLFVYGLITALAATTLLEAQDSRGNRGNRGGDRGGNRPSFGGGGGGGARPNFGSGGARSAPSAPRSAPSIPRAVPSAPRQSSPPNFGRGSRGGGNVPSFSPPRSAGGGSNPTRIDTFRQQLQQPRPGNSPPATVAPRQNSRPEPRPSFQAPSAGGNSGSNQLRDRFEQNRGQSPSGTPGMTPRPGGPQINPQTPIRTERPEPRPRNPTTTTPTVPGGGNQPSVGNPFGPGPGGNRGGAPSGGAPTGRGPESGRGIGNGGIDNRLPGNTGSGNSAVERLRERFQQQNAQQNGRPENGRPAGGGRETPAGTPGQNPLLPNLDGMRDRGGSQRPGGERPGMNRPGAADRSDGGDRPNFGNRPGASDTDRLRELFESRKPSLGQPGGERPDGERPGRDGRPDNADRPGRGDGPGIGERGDNGRSGEGRPGMSDLERLRERIRDQNLSGGDNDRRPGMDRPGRNDGDRPGIDRPGFNLPGLGNSPDGERGPGERGSGNRGDGDRGGPGERGDGNRGEGDRRGNDDNRLGLFRRDGDRNGWKIEPQRFDREQLNRTELADRFRNNERIRNNDDLQRQLQRLQNNPEVREALDRNRLQVNDLSGAFQSRINRRDSFLNISQTNVGRRYNIDQQFNLFVGGDIGRRMDLNRNLIRNGGWSRRAVGPIFPRYTSFHFSSWYPGPSWYPRYCWTPTWSPWVRWSFWDYCRPIYDPRPFICRPIYYYDPCPPITYYDVPQWQSLPVVASGTWVDVPMNVVPAGYDLQLLAVRFVDPGHPEENLGPRFRVWVRNNSTTAVQSPFNVLLAASNDNNLVAGLPEAGVTVDSMEPNAVVPVDIRLPMEANRMNIGSDGQRMPFNNLHVLVDSHRELAETDETNNGQLLPRGEILPVDPAAFATEEPSTFPGSMVSLAGEGFGPEPGQLIVISGGREFPAEVHGWYDLGVYFKMPNVPVSSDNTAQILVIRGDGAASNPVTVSLNPGT